MGQISGYVSLEAAHRKHRFLCCCIYSALHRIGSYPVFACVFVVAYCCRLYQAAGCLSRICLHGNVFTESLPSNGSTCHNNFIRKVLISNLGQDTSCGDWDAPWFSQFFKKMWAVSRLGYCHFLPHPFQFLNHQSPYHVILYDGRCWHCRETNRHKNLNSSLHLLQEMSTQWQYFCLASAETSFESCLRTS
jgi:hypothetical protein